MPTVSTRPPNSEGAMLSACIDPLATASPCIANINSSSFVNGFGSSAFAATTAPTADAAEPPSPEPSGMPFSMCMSKPKSGFAATFSANSARPAVFFSGSVGSSDTTPEEPVMRTPGVAERVTVTRSPRASTAKPRMSKPIATLPTEAGANAVAWEIVTGGLRDTPTGAAGRRRCRRPSLRDPRRAPARSADCCSSGWSRSARRCP